MEEENIAQYLHDHFSESDRCEIFKIIDNTVQSSQERSDTESDVERFIVVLDQYQEQPHLLDPHLEAMVNKLVDIAQSKESPPRAIHLAFKYLYFLSKVRGPKYLCRIFGHEVADLEPILQMLMKQNPQDHHTWETRYILLLWLSMVCMIPFDLVKLDGIHEGNSQLKEKPIMDRILDTAKQYLDVTDASRDMAGLLIGKKIFIHKQISLLNNKLRFMSRADVKDQKLGEFIDWCLYTLSESDGQTMSGMLSMIGLLSTMAAIFKHGRRGNLLPYAPQVLEKIIACDILNMNNTLLRKLGTKVIQRIGLTFLKPRVASWRYQRGNRSLSHNMSGLKQNFEHGKQGTTQGLDNDEEYDIPGEIEEVIENLLTGLKDKDTVVRWSAAKGIGRITGQLPKELADEVVGSLLEFFTLRESESAWHGGCLALAELGRRGLLLPQRLPEVVPVVLKALVYDERKGACSVGANVRDAACYVCWSFARAYDPDELKDYVNQIASALIITTIFDREVNCRRAASAAFQENVGRQGTFPHGIDILTTADYFAVGNRTNSYLNLSVYVAQFNEYTRQLIDHLVELKVTHWDCAIRELTSKALHNLTSIDESYMKETVLPRLMAYSKSIDIYTKHGSIVAASEIIYALYKIHGANLRNILTGEVLETLNDLIPRLLEERQFRGTSGDFMRRAVCKFIENLSLSYFPLRDDTIIESWREIMEDTLPHTEEIIREDTRIAITPFAVAYFQTAGGSAKSNARDALITPYLSKLQSQLHFDRMGFALGIGAFPKSFLKENFKEITSRLMRASTIESEARAGVLAESRRDALLALSRVCSTAGVQYDGDENSCVCKSNINRLFDHYFAAMGDYTIDSRGDVGSWVREAAMSGLEDLTKQIFTESPSLLEQDTCTKVIGSLLHQAFEKIDRTREHAGNIFLRLLYHSPAIPIPCHEELMAIYPSEKIATMNWKSAAEVFPALRKLLVLKPYLYHVLLGLVVSAGGLTESLVRHAAESLLAYVQRLNKGEEEYDRFCQTIIGIFEDHAKDNRVILPLFKVLDLLIGHGCFDKFGETESDPFTVKILELMLNEVVGCTLAKKLLASINVFCGLIQFPGTARTRALSRLMLFLCHKFPRVRKETAEQLYLAFIGDCFSFSEEAVEEIVTILSETQWDSEIETVREARNSICDLLGIPKPKPKVGENKAKENKRDVLESYQDLVGRHDY